MYDNLIIMHYNIVSIVHIFIINRSEEEVFENLLFIIFCSALFFIYLFFAIMMLVVRNKLNIVSHLEMITLKDTVI